MSVRTIDRKESGDEEKQKTTRTGEGCVSVEVYSFSSSRRDTVEADACERRKEEHDEKLLSLFNNVQEDLRIGRCFLAFQQLTIIEDMPWSRYLVSRSSSTKRSRRFG